MKVLYLSNVVLDMLFTLRDHLGFIRRSLAATEIVNSDCFTDSKKSRGGGGEHIALLYF